MNEEYLQNLRYKLQKRVRRLLTVDQRFFHVTLQQFFGFINEQPSILGILDDLVCLHPEISQEEIRRLTQNRTLFDTESENACFAFQVLKYCSNDANQSIESSLGFNYFQRTLIQENLDAFRELFVNPVYEYIDEQLDDQRLMLAVLRRYKQKCEWFQRDSLFTEWESQTQRGEKWLASHLYEYLHDQGINFVIEPSSVSGEADFIAGQGSDDPIIADVKIFNPGRSKGKPYIISGFAQVYQYTLDYNEPFGYLIIFNTSGRDIRFPTQNQSQKTPFIQHNNKTIFIIIIDIFPYDTSASRRGPLSTVEITEEELIQRIEEAGQQQALQIDEENNTDISII